MYSHRYLHQFYTLLTFVFELMEKVYNNDLNAINVCFTAKASTNTQPVISRKFNHFP
jgi:hypothetical protein